MPAPDTAPLRTPPTGQASMFLPSYFDLFSQHDHCFSTPREDPLTESGSSLESLAPCFQNQVKGGLGRTPKMREPRLTEHLGKACLARLGAKDKVPTI